MNRTDTLLLAVFGGVMMVLGVLVSGLLQPSVAQAATAGSGPGAVLVTGLASSNQEVLYLYDGESHKLAVYKVDASNRMTLIAMRDTTFDLKPQEFGKNEPAVQEMKDLFDKHQEAIGAVEKPPRQRR